MGLTNLNKLTPHFAEQFIAPSRSMMKLFGIVGSLNFIIFDVLWNLILHEEYSYAPLRSIAAFLCLCLAISDYCPQKLQKFLVPFWYGTICYCLPFFGTYMFLINHSSPTWNSNIIIGLFWLVLITDWKSFLLTLITGSILGIIYYKSLHGKIYLIHSDMIGLYSNYIWAIVIAILFSRQKEVIMQAYKLKTLTKLNSELEYALAAKTEFLNNMSHEIRTPVQGFTAISQGLADHWELFDEQKKFDLVKQVAGNAKRLGSLVGSLLDLAKFNNAQIRLELKEMNLNASIAKIIDECHVLYLTNRQIDIIFTPGNLVFIEADRERIEQVLRNLFINAIKFTPDGGTIKASIEPFDNNVQVTINDSGVGIPITELESIFLEFNQSSRTKTGAGGTGLGLSICKQIITMHNGKIWAENNIDNGSSFHFMLSIKFNREI